jgi:hypothetical protein
MRARRVRRAVLLLAVILAAMGAASCAAMRVKPWDRDLLAQKKMRFTPQPQEAAVDDHVYFSKEGSTGGMDAAGGGCGCN